MTITVDYWDDEAKEQKTRDATDEEIAEINARKTDAMLPEVPQSIPRKAARLALLNARKFHLIQPAINSMPEPQRTRTQIEWDDSLTFERDNVTVALLAEAIGLDDDHLDALFIAAAVL